MFFTKEEKMAIVNLAVAIQMADEDANKDETLLNSLVFAKLGISSEDLDLAGHMGLKEAINVVAKMTDSEKRFVSSFLGTIILADGEVNPAEIKLWQFISIFCEFPTMTLSDAVKYFSKYIE